MLEAVERALPADAAVCAAAVADWRVVTPAAHKMKKQKNVAPQLTFAENPDILARISQRSINRPQLVVGFAAETDDLLENATAKRQRKACDWIVANDVSADTGIMGGDENAVTLITDAGPECWPRAPKHQVAGTIGPAYCNDLGIMTMLQLAWTDEADQRVALPSYETQGAAGRRFACELCCGSA